MIAQVRAAERVHREHAIAADQATVTEGNSGTTPATFTVTREGHLAPGTATVSFSSPAATSADYTNATQTVTFAAGEASKQVSVNVTGDAVAEANDVVTATISPASGSVGTASASLTILDDEQSSWAIAGPAAGVAEGASGTFTVTRTGATAAATVVLNAAGGTVSAADTNFAAQTLTFASGDTSKTVNVAATQDSDLESNETLSLSITPSAGSVTTATATMTVLDDDQSNWAISTAASAVSEAVGTVALTVERTGASPAATIVLTTAGGTAVAGSDYTGATQTLTFAAGEMSKSVNVAVTDDASVEPNESFNATLSGASAGNIATSSITVEIQDNEQSVWSVAANSDSILEGAGNASFTVSRTGATAAGTIVFATAGVSATSADFTSVNQTLTFADGELSKTVTVALTGDSLLETTETFQGSIQGASSGTIATGTATVSIIDDEQDTWRISTVDNLASTSVSEGATSVAVLVTREGPASAAATIVVATGGGSATAGSDYTGVNQTLTFAAGETQKTVSIALTDDSAPEPNESFNVSISTASAGTLGSQTSVAVELTDNEQALWSVSADQASVSEAAGSAAFTVTRSGKTDVAATIVVSSGGGEATAGSDYTSVNQTLTFAAGQTQQTVQVAIGQDSALESNETFSLTLSSPSAGNIETASASLTINDDDQSTWSIAANASAPIDEGAGSSSFTVTRSGATNNSATVVVNAGGGSATGGMANDYDNTQRTLTFAAGETAKVISVSINNDLLLESVETFNASLTSVSTGVVDSAAASATVTLMDNDNVIWAVVADAQSINEAGGQAGFTVSRTGNVQQTDTIVFSTGAGTAVAGSDFTATTQTLTFAAGETSKAVSVAVLDDSNAETNKTLQGIINGQSNGTIETANAIVTIMDDDQSIWTIAQDTDSLSEGAGSNGYTVSRSGAYGATATIVVSSSGGTATAGATDDYTALAQTLTFAPGQTTQRVNVSVRDDFLMESLETFNVSLSAASTGTIETSAVTTTLIDNDNMSWSVAVQSSPLSEGAGSAVFTVARAGDIASIETVEFYTQSQTASAPGRYSAVSQTLTFAVGQASQSVNVALNDNATSDTSGTFLGIIRNPSGGTIDTTANIASVQVDDNDQSIWSISAIAQTVDEGAGTAGFKVLRTGDISQAATIVVASTGGAANPVATAGSDYTALNSTLTFAAGEASKVVNVALTDDLAAEVNETLRVSISAPSVGALDSASVSGAVVTLLDNDQTVWSVSASETSLLESAGSATYTVTRSGQSSAVATIVFENAGGTADRGSDYIAQLQTLTFAAGQTNQSVSVALVNNSTPEPEEVVSGVIYGQSTGTVATGLQEITLVDDDQMGWEVVKVSDVTEAAGEAGFYVTRSGDVSATATIVFNTVSNLNGVVPDLDYTTVRDRTLTFEAGETQKLVNVPVLQDSIQEELEGFSAVISEPSAGTLVTSSANVALTDAVSKWEILTAGSADGATTADESQGLVALTVSRGTLNAGVTETVVINANTGTLTTGEYTAITNQTLTFAPGQSVQVVNLAIADDALSDGDKTLQAVLSNPSGGFLNGAGAVSTITVLDNEQMSWSVAGNKSLASDAAPYIGEGAGHATFTVSRTGASGAATIEVFSSDFNMRDSEYTPVLQTLSFAAGEMSKQVLVPLIDDSEPDTTQSSLRLSIHKASSGSIVAPSDTAWPVDNDQSSVWQIGLDSPFASEADGQGAYWVKRVGTADVTATVVVSSILQNAHGQATEGQDYSATLTTLTFAPGVTQLTGYVDITNDSYTEYSTEAIQLRLSNISSGILQGAGASAVTLNVRDDENYPTWLVDTAYIGTATFGESSAQAYVRVARQGAASDTATVVVYTTLDGTATPGVDFVPLAPTTLTFAPGQWWRLVPIALLADDSVAEQNETIAVSLRDPSIGALNTSVNFVTLLDNDQSLWSISNPTGAGITEDGGDSTLFVSRTGDISQTATIVVQASPNVAQESSFDEFTQTLTFAAGESGQTVKLHMTDNTGSHNYGYNSETVSLRDPSVGSLVLGSSSLTNYAYDNEKSTGFVDVFGSEETGRLSYRYQIVGNYQGTTTVVLRLDATAGAVEGVDYNPYAATLTFTPGEYVKSVTAEGVFINDSLVETEAYKLTVMSTTVGGDTTYRDYAGLATVNWQELDSVKWSLSSSTWSESKGALPFNVSRTGNISTTETVVFQTLGGTAVAGVDYTPIAPTTLTFAPGQLTYNVILTTFDDAVVNATKTVVGGLSSPSTGVIAGAIVATGTISDDETNNATVWSIASVTSTSEIGGAAAIARVDRSGPAAVTDTVVIQTRGGTATPGLDYTDLPPTTLTFVPGERTKNVSVPVLVDTVAEGNTEIINFVLTNPSSGWVSTHTASNSIYEDDQSVWTVQSAGGSVAEVAGGELRWFVLRGNSGLDTTATVVVQTGGGAATGVGIPGVDYVALPPTTLTFVPGQYMQSVSTTVLADNVAEAGIAETVNLIITGVSSGTVSTAAAGVVILEDEGLLWSIGTVTAQAEGNSGSSGKIVVQVARDTRTDQLQMTDTVVVSSQGGTATPGVDYVALAPTTLTFAPGEQFKTVSVDIVGDTLNEGAETVQFALSSPSRGTTATASVTINDEERSVWAIAASASVVEAGEADLAWQVSRSGNFLNTATIVVQTTGSSGALAGVDYTPLVPTTLTFVPGETTKTVVTAVLDDSLLEGNELVLAAISQASEGQIGTSSAAATIADNDRMDWTLTNYVNANEADSGNANVVGVYVDRTGRLDVTATAVVYTSGGTATAGADYTAVASTLTFGVGETRKVIATQVLDDNIAELAESVGWTLGDVSAGQVGSVQTTSTIFDDDASRVYFTGASVGAVYETSGSAAYSLTRSGDLSGTQTVVYVIGNTGTAVAGVDYSGAVGDVLGTLTFTPGETVKHVHVPLLNNEPYDAASKTLAVNFVQASQGVIADSGGVALTTINDEDAPVAATAFTVAQVAATQESAGAGVFTITRTGDVSADSVVFYRTNAAGPTTLGAGEFTAVADTALTFLAGETVKTVSVALIDDATPVGAGEASAELLNLQVALTNGGAAVANGSLTVSDDDTAAAAATWAAAAVSTTATEGVGFVTYRVTRSGDNSAAATVEAVTGTAAVAPATAGTDYTAITTPVTLSFASGETIKHVTVQIANDSVAEGSEQVRLTLQNASVGTISTANADIAVLDDDVRTDAAATNSNWTSTDLGGGSSYLVDLADGDDSFTVNGTAPSAAAQNLSHVNLGGGNDTLFAGTVPANFLAAGSHWVGGSGLDTLNFGSNASTGAAATYNFRGTTSTGDMVTGFEVFNLDQTGTETAQTVRLALDDLLDITTGNAVARELRIDGASIDVLQISGLGVTGQTGGLAPLFSTPTAGTTITDVDNVTTGNVVANAAGDANANDVTLGANVYDVYQFNTAAGTFTLLVDTDMTKTFIA